MFTVHLYDEAHPITRGMKDFEITDETYRYNYHPNAQMRSLLRMRRDGERAGGNWTGRADDSHEFLRGTRDADR